MSTQFPPSLKKGNTIGITLPAGYMAAEKLETCIATLQDWGYNVIVGKTVGSDSKTYFSGTDEDRLIEMQAMLDSPDIDAILCGRGGYGTGRIIDKLDFKLFKKHPKWIIGFSDITVLHCHLFSRYKIASLHAPMGAAFNDDGFKNQYVQSLKNALFGKKAVYKEPANPANRIGKAKGKLVGGNLALFAHCIGSKSEPKTDDCILFLEDIGEQFYAVDRMLRQLDRAGKLKNIAALIIGHFSDMNNTERPFGKSLEDIVYEIVGKYHYPVCFNFPVGHDAENYALKVGGTYSLSIGKNETILKEMK